MVVAALSSGLTAAMTQRTLKGSAGRNLGYIGFARLAVHCSQSQLYQGTVGSIQWSFRCALPERDVRHLSRNPVVS